MGSLVWCDGLLEPIELKEPFQAVITVLDAGINSGKSFYVGQNNEGEPEAILIPKIIHISGRPDG